LTSCLRLSFGLFEFQNPQGQGWGIGLAGDERFDAGQIKGACSIGCNRVLPALLLSLSPEPAGKNKDFTGYKKRAEDRFVVAGQPEWQVDIEVVGAVIRIPGCHIGQRAAATVRQHDDAFQQDKDGNHQRPVESPIHPRKGNRDNTGGEERPHDRMDEFDQS
jgi:hypothetical protein